MPISKKKKKTKTCHGYRHDQQSKLVCLLPEVRTRVHNIALALN